MKRFFQSLNELKHYFYHACYSQRQLVCQHCHQSEHWVLHSLVYKYVNHGKRYVAGQRLFCSNRFQHTGCGRTWRLYLAVRIPKQHYDCRHWFRFIQSLIKGSSIAKAYCLATACTESRHAYRWLNKLAAKQLDFRQQLQKPTDQPSAMLSLLTRLFTAPIHHCQDYQTLTGQSWI